VDLATVASWPAGDAREVAALLRKALRVTDVITSSGEGLQVLMSGCDEVGAATALRRVPVPPTGLRLATTAELLCGASAEGMV
jgi:hypothetical protein